MPTKCLFGCFFIKWYKRFGINQRISESPMEFEPARADDCRFTSRHSEIHTDGSIDHRLLTISKTQLLSPCNYICKPKQRITISARCWYILNKKSCIRIVVAMPLSNKVSNWTRVLSSMTDCFLRKLLWYIFFSCDFRRHFRSVNQLGKSAGINQLMHFDCILKSIHFSLTWDINSKILSSYVIVVILPSGKRDFTVRDLF